MGGWVRGGCLWMGGKMDGWGCVEAAWLEGWLAEWMRIGLVAVITERWKSGWVCWSGRASVAGCVGVTAALKVPLSALTPSLALLWCLGFHGRKPP